MMKRVYDVPDMHCPACSMLLEGIEDDLPGIRRISASYHKQRLEVDFDEGQVSEAAIVTAANALGYHLIRREG
jgi:copper chaperone CopZ